MAQEGYALVYVPQKLHTEDLCRIAAHQNGGALTYVPENLLTDEMCRLAVAQDGEALIHVPEALRTEGICSIAVGQNNRALIYVPQNLRDRVNALAPASIPEWDISLLDELDSLLGATSSPAPLGVHHA
jgi:hypothetical protein